MKTRFRLSRLLILIGVVALLFGLRAWLTPKTTPTSTTAGDVIASLKEAYEVEPVFDVLSKPSANWRLRRAVSIVESSPLAEERRWPRPDGTGLNIPGCKSYKWEGEIETLYFIELDRPSSRSWVVVGQRPANRIESSP